MSSIALPLLSKIKQRLGSSAVGWIGIDVGTRAVKLAQLAWNGDVCRIERRWVLPTQELVSSAAVAESPDRPMPLPANLRAARKLFQGSATAAVLPMSLLNFRTIEVPHGTPEETASMIEQDLLADLPGTDEGVAFDYWDAAVRDQRGSDSVRVSVLAAPRKAVARFADELLNAGFDCRVLDGAPCALARAVALAEGHGSDDPAAAIDLGHGQPLFVVAQRGRPVFARALRGCDLQSLTKPLCEGLSVDAAQAEQLLLRFGVCAAIGQAPKLSVEQATHRLVGPQLANLVVELERTLGYLAQQFREFVPRRLWLFGGGGTFPCLAEHLTHKLGVTAAPWSLPGARGAASRGDALFGVAAALSMLACKEQS